MPASRWPMGSLEAGYARHVLRLPAGRRQDEDTRAENEDRGVAPTQPGRHESTRVETRTRTGPTERPRSAGRSRLGRRSDPATPGARSSREIRIHGNAFLTDEEVADFAGIARRRAAGRRRRRDDHQRLKDSGKFETVDVRKRYRSLESTTDVALDPGRPRKAGRALGGRRGQHPGRAGYGRAAGRAAAQQADVPADPQLRRRLRLHLRRTGEHDGSARRRRAAVGAADVGRHAPRRARIRAHVQDRAADAHLVELRRSGTARIRASRSTISGSRSTARAERSLRRRLPRGRRRQQQHDQLRRDSTTTCGRSAHVAASTPGAIPPFPATPIMARPAGPACTSAAIPETDQPLHGRRPRLSSASSGRPCSPAACLHRRRRARSADLRAAAARRRIDPARVRHRRIRRRSDVRRPRPKLRVPITSVLSGAKLGADGVHTTPARPGTSAAGWKTRSGTAVPAAASS